MTVATRILPLAFAAFVFGAPALAQQPKEPAVPAEPAPPKLDQKACADRDQMTTGGDIKDGDKEHLSDKLARTDGVICPPAHMDPDIRAPAPNGSNMPVIPPPGGPGGDPTVRPK